MVTTNLDPVNFDRTDFFPIQEGDHVLPHDLMFHRLYFLALNQNTTAVRDPCHNHEINYHQLLSDVLATRNLLRQQLTATSMEMIRKGDEISVLVVARGYHFVVGFLAVMCLGAIVVPQSELSRRLSFSVLPLNSSARSSSLFRGAHPCNKNITRTCHTVFFKPRGAVPKHCQQPWHRKQLPRCAFRWLYHDHATRSALIGLFFG
jgi:hypothetical protein